MGYEQTINQIISLINRSQRILILPSTPVDGDSVGSAIAFYIVLKKLNKDVTVVCNDPIPDVLKFLPKISSISQNMNSSNDFIISINDREIEIANLHTTREGDKFNIVITPKNRNITPDDVTFLRGESEYDLIITVDCAELKQLKGIYENNTELFHSLPVINIDHHISNTNYGKINHVDVMASSATEIIFSILKRLSEEHNTQLIDEDVATLLLTGIITDTGSFQNANTTPRSFAKAAELVAYGARQQEIIQQIYKTKQLSQLKLWGRVLSKIQTDETHKIVWSVVTQQDLKDTESLMEQTGDIIDELMTNAPGAEVIVLIKEKENGQISGSIRTTHASVDASAIAEHFGGGGHTQAAGFTMQNTTPSDAEYKIINHIKDYQKNHLNIKDGAKAPSSKKSQKPIIDVQKLIAKIKEVQKVNQIMPTIDDSSHLKIYQPEDTADQDDLDQEESAQSIKKAPEKQPKSSAKNSIKSTPSPKSEPPKTATDIHKNTYRFEE
ncbi:hypothetical protein CVV38_01900 [Candidatus Peregrinibacteria bacterium HGW-Peregrinibacteria-1]|jgi:phosphoesterase RecJ-like protein|nr:MAG: hypothetical protein CVV38_01900 [Candidatus Peregrinibacteria bacterium HGW-Peregrinibacteria-1]